MSAVILFLHAPCATAFREAAEGILGRPSKVSVIDVPIADPTKASPELMRQLEGREYGQCLILTDLPGSTPHRLALEAVDRQGGAVVSGVSLPMVLRAVNYMDQAPTQLATRCQTGAVSAINWSPDNGD